MNTPLGKIVASTSHIHYEARIYDSSECSKPPQNHAYALGSFVRIHPHNPIQQAANGTIVGIIVNSRLINPDMGHYGPRLTMQQEQNAIFAPDYLNELGTLIHILLVGYLQPQGGQQGLVREVLSVSDEVQSLTSEECKRFHRSDQGRFQMHYAALVQESGIPMAHALLQTMCTQLQSICAEEKEHQMLQLLQKHFARNAILGTQKGR